MKKDRLGFNIVLLGQTASGKETQTRILEQRYALKSVETGVFTRKLLKAKTPDGEWARRTAGKGQPLPVPLLKEFLIKEIKNHPKGKDLIFLGGPRLKPEAQLLKKLLAQKGQDFIAFYITLPDKEVYRRSLQRATDKDTKAIYKVFDNKKIIAARLKYYREQVTKTVKYFEGLGKLTKINGNQPIAKVTSAILKTIEGYKKTKTAG